MPKKHIILSIATSLLIVLFFFGGDFFSLLPQLLSGGSLRGSIEEGMKECLALSGQKGHDCLNILADSLLEEGSVRDVFQALADAQEIPEVYSRCHELAHFLGRVAYKHSGDVGELYTEEILPSCHGGGYHGVMEAYLAHVVPDGNPRKLPEAVLSSCDSLLDVPPAMRGECHHGVGHALMFVTGNDLPRALTYCDSFLDRRAYEACWSGVFMENSSSSTGEHASLYVREGDVDYPCSILDEKYSSLCYTYQSSLFLVESGGSDFAGIAKKCSRVPLPYRDECFRTMGTNAVGHSQSLENMQAICAAVREEGGAEAYASCIEGVADALVGRYGGDARTAYLFCDKVLASERSICRNKVKLSSAHWAL